MKIFKASLFILALSALFCSGLSAQSDLEKGFANPPQSAKAFIWLPEWYLKNQPKPDDGKIAFSVVKLFEVDEPLYDSGRVGPVVIRTAIEK